MIMHSDRWHMHSDRCKHGWHGSTCCELPTTEELAWSTTALQTRKS